MRVSLKWHYVDFVGLQPHIQQLAFRITGTGAADGAMASDLASLETAGDEKSRLTWSRPPRPIQSPLDAQPTH